MSGICGILGADSAYDAGRRMGAMISSIAHRGRGAPHRLARVEMEFGAYSPVGDDDSGVVAIVDGHIDNASELRDQLAADGHRFVSNSDAELLVHGYQQWGQELPHHLDGTFALAIWDARERCLIVVRDRFGEKPVYWCTLDGETIFASEIKALFQAGVPADLDDAGLADYLAHRYVAAPGTMFRGIQQLEAGHLLHVDDNGPTVRRWWALNFEPKTHMALPQAAARADELLRQSVAQRMTPATAVGCITTGDALSNTMTSLMAELSTEPIHTFAVGIEYDAPDHLAAAQLAADAFGTHHHELRIDPTRFLELLAHAVWQRDEPLAEPEQVLSLALGHEAREYVDAVLTPIGADEVFANGVRYRAALAAGRLGRLAGPLRRTPARRILGARSADADPWLGAALAPSRPVEPDVEGGGLDRLVAADIGGRLVDVGLVGGDRMTGAAGLDSRAPYLDRDLVEFVARLPEHLKATPLRSHVLARRITDLHLPKALRGRGTPPARVSLTAWFQGDLGDRTERMLTSARARRRALVAESESRAVFAAHRSGRQDLTSELWALLNLEVWARIFLDGDDPADVAIG